MVTLVSLADGTASVIAQLRQITEGANDPD